jgi:signal transduction histidine kinase
MTVSDDGRGMTAMSARGMGMGIRSMRYRAGVIGAQLEIGNGDHEGTVVRCVYCLKQRPQRGQPDD